MRIVGARALCCQENRYNRAIVARILYLITSSGVGGAELALWQLLRRLDRSRWEPTVVSLKPPGEIAGRIRALGIEVLSPGIGDETGAFAALELLLEARRLPRLLGGERFDIVHSLLFRAHLLGRLAARRVGAPRSSTPSAAAPRRSGWLLRADRWTSRRVTCFLRASGRSPRPCSGALGLARRSCVRAIPNGVDLAEADARVGRGTDDGAAAVGPLPDRTSPSPASAACTRRRGSCTFSAPFTRC